MINTLILSYSTFLGVCVHIKMYVSTRNMSKITYTSVKKTVYYDYLFSLFYNALFGNLIRIILAVAPVSINLCFMFAT